MASRKQLQERVELYSSLTRTLLDGALDEKQHPALRAHNAGMALWADKRARKFQRDLEELEGEAE